MSTIETVELREKERRVLIMVAEAAWKLAAVRGLQTMAAEKETEMYAKSEQAIEAQNEALGLRIEEICKGNALGIDGAPLALLDRIRGRLAFLEEQSEEFPRLGGYTKLVHLCMQGARQDSDGLFTIPAEADIVAEVDRLKAAELRF